MKYLKILYFLLLIALAANTSAQSNDDSLKRVLATSKDAKQKIKILTTLSDD